MDRECSDVATCLALLLILGCIVVQPTAYASVSDLTVTPEVADPGDSITITGKAAPGEEVWLSSSFEISLPVSDGKYSRKFDDIHFPEGKKRFTVTAKHVKNIRISLWLIPLVPVSYPLDGPKAAVDGSATIALSLPITMNGDEMDLTGEKDIKVYGDALDDATVVNVQTKSELQVAANANGDFSLQIDTGGIPESEFVISAGGIKRTVYLGVTPTPTPRPTPTPAPTSTGNGGGTADSSATPTPSPSATVTPPAPSASPSPLPSPSPAPGVITVRIADLTVASGETATTKIRIEDVGGAGLRSARITLTYDPAVVTVLSAESSDFDEFTANIENGMVRMTGFQIGAEGLTGDLTFAQLQLKAAGKPDDTTILGLDVNELMDNRGTSLTEQGNFEVKWGSFTVKSADGPEPSEPSNSRIPAIGAFGTMLTVITGFCLLLLLKRRCS